MPRADRDREREDVLAELRAETEVATAAVATVEGAPIMPQHSNLALVIFRDLENHARPTDRELPQGIDRNTYEWVRELVVRSRRQLVLTNALIEAVETYKTTCVLRG